jgi:hypothetical protein
VGYDAIVSSREALKPASRNIIHPEQTLDVGACEGDGSGHGDPLKVSFQGWQCDAAVHDHLRRIKIGRQDTSALIGRDRI